MSIILEGFITSVRDLWLCCRFICAAFGNKDFWGLGRKHLSCNSLWWKLPIFSLFWYRYFDFSNLYYLLSVMGNGKRFERIAFFKFLPKNCNNLSFSCRHLITLVSKHPSPDRSSNILKMPYWIVKLHQYENPIFWVMRHFQDFRLQFKFFLIMKINAPWNEV